MHLLFVVVSKSPEIKYSDTFCCIHHSTKIFMLIWYCVVVQWLSLLHNFTQPFLKLGSTQFQILLVTFAGLQWSETLAVVSTGKKFRVFFDQAFSRVISANNGPLLFPYIYFNTNIFNIIAGSYFEELSQSAITCSKLTIDTLEQGVKYVQSWQ